MERRSFIKNIAALAAISQIGITAVASINPEFAHGGLVLHSDGEGNRQWTKLSAPIDHNHHSLYKYESLGSWHSFN